MCPVQSEGPAHWTLLTVQKQKNEKFKVSYFESLGLPSVAAQSEARQLFALLYNLIGASKFEDDELPVPDTSVRQADGWSCGYQVCHRIEEQYKQFRGESRFRIYNKPDETRQELNKWVKAVMDTNAREGGAAMGGEAAAIGGESSSNKLPPPPLPPPPPGPVGPVKAERPTGLYGCSRCRYSERGCASCCTEKMLRMAVAKK